MKLREALFVAATATAGCADDTVIDKISAGLKGGENPAHELQRTPEEIKYIRRECDIRLIRAVGFTENQTRVREIIGFMGIIGLKVEDVVGERHSIVVDNMATNVRNKCLDEHGLPESL